MWRAKRALRTVSYGFRRAADPQWVAMVLSPEPLVPRPGDIILRKAADASCRSQQYTLSTSDEPPQIACATYEEALGHARRFAQSQHLDVWETDDTDTFQHVIEYRVAARRTRT